MSELVVTSAAELDFTEALRWFAERSAQAAENFVLEFDRVLEMIALDPRRFPRCDERHHFCLLRRFPHQVIYREHGE